MITLTHRLFSHDSKVRDLNLNLKCSFWLKIRKTVFWTVYMPNHIAMRNLKCTIQMMVRVIRIIIWIAHLKLHIAMWFWRTHGPNYRLSNFNSKCAFQIKITHFAVVWNSLTLFHQGASVRLPIWNSIKLVHAYMYVRQNVLITMIKEHWYYFVGLRLFSVTLWMTLIRGNKLISFLKNCHQTEYI